YQIYLYEEQKQFLLKYIRERRADKIILLWTSAIICIIMFLLLRMNILMDGSFEMNELNSECILYMLASGFIFVRTFIKNFGKTFGYGCDKKCIENDWYTITSGNFVYRDKNPHNKHPYYISDKSYNQYICPRFIDWRNANKDTMFLYIKLENGSNYAITDDIYILTK
ncbi:MAG: hypothetical protein K2K02_04970, partial [Ruminococcus sp.]|nr:hypothetical protein [Ruminococcus sp.]